MISSCELCHYTGTMLPFYPEKDIVQCPSCRLIFYGKSVNPRSLYTKDYFMGGEYRDYLFDKKILQRNFRQRVKQLQRIKPCGRLLELGSAYGFFLELAQEHWSVKGIDIVAEGIKYTQHILGLEAILADFMALPDELESYDLICMWDTIEHLPNPVHFIAKAGRWLKSGGVLAMTTGDVESLLSRLRKKNWRLIHPPTHLFYFSAKTLGQSVQQAGLKVVDVSHVGYYRSLRTMLYGLFALGNKKPAWLYALFASGGCIDLPIYLNLYDIMMLVAQKPNVA